MIVKETQYIQPDEKKMYGEEDRVVITNGKTTLDFHPGEPEDNTFSRDWSDIFKIMKFAKEIAKAVKNQEEVIFIREELPYNEYRK